MQTVEQTVIGLAAGIFFGVVGFFAKRDKSEDDEGNIVYEPWKWSKLLRTMVIYGSAGALVGYYGEPITQGRIEMATMSTIILGELFDKVYPTLRDQVLAYWNSLGDGAGSDCN